MNDTSFTWTRPLSKAGQRDEASRFIFRERAVILGQAKPKLPMQAPSRTVYRKANFTYLHTEADKSLVNKGAAASPPKPSAVFVSQSREAYTKVSSPPHYGIDTVLNVSYDAISRKTHSPLIVKPTATSGRRLNIKPRRCQKLLKSKTRARVVKLSLIHI